MATSSLALRTTQATLATPAWELRTGSAVHPHILEFSVIMAVAPPAAWSIGLGRPASFSPVSQIGYSFEMDDPAEAPSSNVAFLTWAQNPVVPNFFIRRFSAVTTTVGTGIVWTFNRGLPMPIGGSMVIWNITATNQMDVSCVLDE